MNNSENKFKLGNNMKKFKEKVKIIILKGYIKFKMNKKNYKQKLIIFVDKIMTLNNKFLKQKYFLTKKIQLKIKNKFLKTDGKKFKLLLKLRNKVMNQHKKI